MKSTHLAPFIFLIVIACNNDKNARDELRGEVEMKNRQSETLKQTLTAQELEAEKARKAYEEEVASVRQNVSQLSQSIQDKNQAIAALESTLASREADRQALAQKLEAERLQAAADKAKLERDLAAKEASLNASETSLANANNSLAAAKEHEASFLESINDLTSDIQKKNSEIAKLDEKIKAANAPADAVADLTKKLETAKKDLAQLEAEKAKADSELAQSRSIITESLSDMWGMYYSRQTVSFDSMECRQLVYVKNQGGAVSAIVCPDGRMQWEESQAKSFAAVNDSTLDGSLGFKMISTNTTSSCKPIESAFKLGSEFAFDRGSRLGESVMAPSLATRVSERSLSLDTTSLSIGYNECEDLLAVKASGGFSDAESNAILDMTVRVCKKIQGLEPEPTTQVGCFTPNNIFVK